MVSFETLIRTANGVMLVFAIFVAVQFSPAFTVGMLGGLVIIAIGNIVGLLSKNKGLLIASLGVSAGGLAFFLNSSGTVNLPIPFIFFMFLLPIFFVELVEPSLNSD